MFLPRCAAGAVSAYRSVDPARLASVATPVYDRQAYELEGVKLRTTNGCSSRIAGGHGPSIPQQRVSRGVSRIRGLG